MDYYVKTPEEGVVLGRIIGPKGPSIWVENVPRDVPREDVEKLLHDIAWSRFGLRISQGDSMYPVCLRWDQILAQAESTGVDYPPSVVASIQAEADARKRRWGN